MSDREITLVRRSDNEACVGIWKDCGVVSFLSDSGEPLPYYQSVVVIDDQQIEINVPVEVLGRAVVPEQARYTIELAELYKAGYVMPRRQTQG